ncbi:unnamed protein product [marine sediment metagenome]|uniref:Uncharacterized protein n=1 Tax=marine sediment metagenome TaxID=412755 RepID=X1QLE6_9ZZZZ
MGTDPTFPVYYEGEECTHCASVIFNDETPLYIDAFFAEHVSDVFV